MHIALFGGSFNPPHVAHQLVALYVLETEAVDELWLVPTFKHPFDKRLEEYAHRFEMCALAAAALGPRVRVSDIERELGDESRTLRTVRTLQQRRPSDVFSLVIGADVAAETEAWYGAEELRRTVPFIVVGRSGAPGQGWSLEMPPVSSTVVRERLGTQGREAVKGLVPRSVLDYIYANGLYGARERP